MSKWKSLEPVELPEIETICWAAGFIEGDGHIDVTTTTKAIDVTQKIDWPLVKLQYYFGGSISIITKQGINKNNYFRWRLSGDKAVFLATSIHPFMSPQKQEQIKKMLEKNNVKG